MDLTDKEFNEKKFDKYLKGIVSAKKALEYLDEVSLSQEELEKIEAFTYVFSLRGCALIERAKESSVEIRLEHLQSLWALAIAMYALGRKHENTREHNLGEG